MNFTIDFAGFAAAAAENPVSAALWVLGHGGWVFLLPLFGYLAVNMWLEWRRGVYDSQRQFVTLAIDVPRNNEQTPRAIEHFYAHLSGIHGGPKGLEVWWEGEIPDSISLEIVSLGGYVQFVVQTLVQYRDLVEAAIYAQYPEAEITEVEDYAMRFRGITFPNDRFDVWGSELKMTNKQYFPIKLYHEFEDSVSGEFKDPMAALLEIMSKISPDEQVWLQFVITPANNDWGKPGEQLAQKMIGIKTNHKSGLWERLGEAPLQFLSLLGETLSGGTAVTQKRGEPYSQLPFVSPSTRETVEAIERKVGKIGFHTRVRLVYVARKSAFSKATRVNALFGAIKQFNTLDKNGFKPNMKKTTKVYGFFKTYRLNYRKNRIMRLYRMRARHYTPGYYGEILNTEELATLYHFPVMQVKTPLLRRTEAKRAEPPVSLPVAPFEPPSGPPTGSV